jgi:vitamin B12 transporter
VRHDEDSEFGGKSTGSLAWGWAFMPQWRATASAATSFRVPTLFQRFSQYGNPATWCPNRAATSNWACAGLPPGSEASLAPRGATGSANLINVRIAGRLCSSFGCYQSVGRAELTGVTLAGRTMVAGIGLRGSLDWHDPRNVDTDKVLPRRARRLATLGADTVLGGWTLGADVQAAGAALRQRGQHAVQRLGGYGLVNVSWPAPR